MAIASLAASESAPFPDLRRPESFIGHTTPRQDSQPVSCSDFGPLVVKILPLPITQETVERFFLLLESGRSLSNLCANEEFLTAALGLNTLFRSGLQSELKAKVAATAHQRIEP
jgi:hypothetical protein